MDIKPYQMTPVDFDPFAPGEIGEIAPTTEAQKEIWLSAQFGNEANCAFNESMSFRIKGDFDPQIFRDCILELPQRHDALRATFSTDGNTICFSSDLTIDIPIVDLTNTPESDALLSEQILQQVTKPFDLGKGPLLRAKIFKLQSQLYHILFTAHHIICDGWSMAIIIQDLKHLYHAKKNGGQPDLSEADKFCEYAVEDYEQLHGAYGITANEYWTSLYQTPIPVLDLPTDYPRPAIRTFDANRIDHCVDPHTVKALKQTGAKFGCTFIIILIAAFKTFLFRLTGQENPILGVPAAGQLASGRDRLVGHCVNLLPLISHLQGSMKFSDYLKSVRRLMLDANQYQRFTFGTLVKKLQLPRDPSRIPIVPVIFNIDQQTKQDELKIEGIDFAVSTNHRKYENFELFFNLVSSASGDKLSVECTYNSNLFLKETIHYRLAEFETLLQAVTEHPDQQLQEIPILPDHEKELLFKIFNNTAADYPRDRCFHHLFEDQVLITPHKIAVETQTQKISYMELNSKANQLANYLIDMGVGPDVMVGLFMDRSIDMLVSLLGILKAGGAYVPLDPDYPKERLSYMLTEAQTPVLISQLKFQEDLPQSDARLVFIDSDWNHISQMSGANPTFPKGEKEPGPENLAYVIFTSGSTGTPKGVQVPHRAVVNFLTSMKEKPGMTPKDTLLAVTTLSFDIHVLELYLPLVSGAKIVLATRESAMDGSRLADLLLEKNITVMQATPSTWRLLLDTEWPGKDTLKVLCGGEAFPKDLVDKLVPRVKSVWNMYGPTETTVWSTCHQLKEGASLILVGRPIANTQLYILDRQKQPVPIGVPGELYIGGDGVTHGYLNRPDLTNKQFVPCPHPSNENAVLYKTGDLARYRPDGNVEFLGRLDNQVKVRGFRIELGEIEGILEKHPSIKQAIVGVKKFAPGDQRLIAYFETDRDRTAVDITDLRKHLSKALPPYMVPQHFVKLPKFPLTPAGKVDRKSMPMPEGIQVEPENPYTAPKTPREKEIAQIWEEVLNLKEIGIKDNFFEIGGHSLIGMQVINRLQQKINRHLSFSIIFEAPTIELMSKLIDTKFTFTSGNNVADKSLATEQREIIEI